MLTRAHALQIPADLKPKKDQKEHSNMRKSVDKQGVWPNRADFALAMYRTTSEAKVKLGTYIARNSNSMYVARYARHIVLRLVRVALPQDYRWTHLTLWQVG